MSVSKHNLWKRKKNGVLKLVRSHKMWLERRKHRMRIKNGEDVVHNDMIKNKTPLTKPKVTTTKKTTGSQKRTQVGKRV